MGEIFFLYLFNLTPLRPVEWLVGLCAKFDDEDVYKLTYDLDLVQDSEDRQDDPGTEKRQQPMQKSLTRLGEDRTEFSVQDGGESMRSALWTDNLSEMQAQAQTVGCCIRASGRFSMDSRSRPTGASYQSLCR